MCTVAHLLRLLERGDVRRFEVFLKPVDVCNPGFRWRLLTGAVAGAAGSDAVAVLLELARRYNNWYSTDVLLSEMLAQSLALRHAPLLEIALLGDFSLSLSLCTTLPSTYFFFI